MWQLEAIYTGGNKATVANPFVLHIRIRKGHQFTVTDLLCSVMSSRTASSVGRIKDKIGSIRFCHVAPLASCVDTVTQNS